MIISFFTHVYILYIKKTKVNLGFFLLADSSARACADTGTAVNASIFVDNSVSFFTELQRGSRADVDAGTAAYTHRRINSYWHNQNLLAVFIITRTEKNTIPAYFFEISMPRSFNCLGSTVFGASDIRQVAEAVFGKATTSLMLSVSLKIMISLSRPIPTPQCGGVP